MHPGSQRGHAARTGNHLQFLSRGFPGEGAAMGRDCANSRVTSLASSWPAAGRGREQIWDAEEQIKTMTDEFGQEEQRQLPSLLLGK